MGLVFLPTKEDIDNLGKTLSEKGFTNSLWSDFLNKRDHVAHVMIK
jgi:hypothetical protein